MAEISMLGWISAWEYNKIGRIRNKSYKKFGMALIEDKMRGDLL